MSATAPGHRLVLTAVCFLALASPGCNRENPDDLAFRAQAKLNAGRPMEAAKALKRLEHIRRLTPGERILLSYTASARGQIDEALGALDASDLPTAGALAVVIASRRGALEVERHHFRAAEAQLKRALVLDPGSVDARRRLISLYVQQGRSAEIRAHSRALARTTKLDFLELLVWTLARHEPVDTADLADALARAVRADPLDRASQLALAEYTRRLGRLDEADRALGPLPATDPEVCALRARVALDRGDVDEASALLKNAEGSQDHPWIAQLQGRLALARDDAPAAVRYFRAALKAAPDDRDTQFGLAQALRLSGQSNDARSFADAARAQDRLEWLVQTARAQNRRNDPATLQTIAEACLALGRRDEARAWYQLALGLAPDNPGLRKSFSELSN
jgi:tetratricopeptide (TPR) repeat protein